MFKVILCIFRGHDWANDTRYPVSGWYDEPVSGSYCLCCGKAVK